MHAPPRCSTSRSLASSMARKRTTFYDLLRDGTFYGLVLFEQLPRDQPSTLQDMSRLGHAFVHEHAEIIDSEIEKVRSCDGDTYLLSDQLVERALTWASEQMGFEFLRNERCPY